MTKAAIWAILILATGAVIAGLWFFREILTQVALALILFLAIEAMAVHIRRLWPKLPHWAGTVIAIIATLGVVGYVGYEIAVNIGSMINKANVYEARIDRLVVSVYQLFHVPSPPPSVSQLLAKIDVASVLTQIAAAVQSVAGNTVFILIYLGFMFPAAARIYQKLDNIFPETGDRDHTRDVLTAIRRSMAQYLWVQTVLSAVTTVATFVTLLALGLENALFWSFLIFFLNYIPTIGSIIAVVLPTAFALVQFPTLGPVILVALGVGVWQFLIGNLVAPRMMGESLNLSSLVVLIALAFWGQLWGLTGAFLAAPLMVMIMLTLAQFPNTRWIAILLSEDGEPGVPRRARNKPAGLVDSSHVRDAAPLEYPESAPESQFHQAVRNRQAELRSCVPPPSLQVGAPIRRRVAHPARRRFVFWPNFAAGYRFLSGMQANRREILLSLGALCASGAPAFARAQTTDFATLVALGAEARCRNPELYDPAYRVIAYPMGDVPDDRGVCADTVIRAFRAGGVDLQALVHADMKAAFASYPQIWGLKRPDTNIDHRRVPNLETFLKRAGAKQPPNADPTLYLPGDVVSWRIPVPHIGVVSTQRTASGRPVMAHNIGAGSRMEDVLFAWPIQGWFRYRPS